MKRFARLFYQLDETSKPDRQVELLVEYFQDSSPGDSAWCIGLLSGQLPKRTVVASTLKQWFWELGHLPDWLLEESRSVVGDLCETIALLLPQPITTSYDSLSVWLEDRLLPLRALDEPTRKESVFAAWQELDGPQRVVFNKLLTGSLKTRVAPKLVTSAISKHCGLPVNVIAFRLKESWQPSASFFESLIQPDCTEDDVARPYPFSLATPLTWPR